MLSGSLPFAYEQRRAHVVEWPLPSRVESEMVGAAAAVSMQKKKKKKTHTKKASDEDAVIAPPSIELLVRSHRY